MTKDKEFSKKLFFYFFSLYILTTASLLFFSRKLNFENKNRRQNIFEIFNNISQEDIVFFRSGKNWNLLYGEYEEISFSHDTKKSFEEICEEVKEFYESCKRLKEGVYCNTLLQNGGIVGFVSYDFGLRKFGMELDTQQCVSTPLLEFRCYEKKITERNGVLQYTPTKKFSLSPFQELHSKKIWQEGFQKTKKNIFEGEFYQLNLTRQFSADFSGSPKSLFLELFQKNSSPHAMFWGGENHNILSASPESFLRFEGYGRVVTEPIKGTRPRGGNSIINYELGIINALEDCSLEMGNRKKRKEKEEWRMENGEEDQEKEDIKTPYMGVSGKSKLLTPHFSLPTPQSDEFLRNELLSSEKESAELMMITDLLRNDLSQTSEVGSIRVEMLREIQKNPTVWHTFSKISGKIQKKYSPLDTLFSCLPAGSISGCPKKRACEEIKKLEPHQRGVFCGIFGFLDFEEKGEFSVLIRSLFHSKGVLQCTPTEKIYFQAGGGITADSQESEEFGEINSKSRAFFDLTNIK